MEVKISGLSRDMIIHPGETLREVMKDRNMSQQELAYRTGVTPKHISTVLNGEKKHLLQKNWNMPLTLMWNFG